jgi:beta-lactam-binding protein with PASTA domain
MKKAILIILMAFITISAYAQNNDQPTREAFKLTLAVDDTNFYATDIKQSAYVLKDNTIQIYPGEKVYIETEVANNEVKSMKCVKLNLHPEKTITLSFEQIAEGKKHQRMMLKVSNPFDAKLTYKAHIFLMKQKRWVATSALPVLPKKDGYEIWPEVIITIAVSDWKLE